MGHYDDIRDFHEEQDKKRQLAFKEQQLQQGRVEVPHIIASMHPHWRVGEFVPKDVYDRFIVEVRGIFGIVS